MATTRVLNLSERKQYSERLGPGDAAAVRTRLNWWAESAFAGDKRRRNRWFWDVGGLRIREALNVVEVDRPLIDLEHHADWLECHSEALGERNWQAIGEELARNPQLVKQLELDSVAYPFMVWAMPRIEAAFARLRAAGIEVGPDALVPVRNHLGNRLHIVSERAAILGMNAASVGGLVTGESYQQRSADFVARMLDPEQRRQLLSNIPVLDRRLAHVCAGAVAAAEETIDRLIDSWPQLRDTFSLKGTLLALEPGLGDPHKNNRTVTGIKFEGGALIYKPRSMAVDQAFAQLVRWTNERSGLSLPVPVVLDRRSHGWTNFVGSADCVNESEVREAHFRAGGLLALLHLCGAHDVHYENIIFDRADPYVIDLETALAPYPRGFGEAKIGRSRWKARQDTVLQTGYLPVRSYMNGAVIDLSAVGLYKEQDSPVEMPVLDDQCRDEVKIVRRRGKMTPEFNHPRIAGDHRPAFEYPDEVQRGFSSVYTTLLANRAELTSAEGPLAAFADVEIRWVPRATLEYAKTQANTYHPFALRDGVDHDVVAASVLDPRSRHGYLRRIVAAEIADIWRGDIPYFSASSSSRDVKTSSGKVISSFFEKSAYDGMLRRARQLSRSDLQRQHSIIRMSLSSVRLAGGPPQPDRSFAGARRRVPTADLLVKSVEIGDKLIAHELVNSGCSYWVGMRGIGDNAYAADIAGGEIYTGSGGIGIFLAELYRATGLDRFRDAAKRCLNSVRATNSVNDGAVGAYEGMGSLLYAELRIMKLIGDARANRLRDRLRAIRELTPRDKALDVIAGSAGALLTVLAAAEIPEIKDEALEVGLICGEKLQETAKVVAEGSCWECGTFETPLTGFSHGTSGIAYALAALAKATDRREFADLAWQALRFEEHTYDPEARGWRDRRWEGAYPCTWCHGATGITLARQKLAELGLAGAPDLSRDIERGLDALLYRGSGGSHCLCHGLMGNLEPLFRAGGEYEDIAQAAIFDAFRTMLEEAAPRCGLAEYAETPDLMTGIAGVGLGMLRAVNPRIPSVLLLEVD